MCAYPNDSTFLFCQRCGYNRKPASNSNSPLTFPLDLSGIDARLRTLQSVSQNKAYQKQISKLHLELERFLQSVPLPKSVYNATPNDIARFLVWKDNSGKTKVHIPSCPLFGSKRPDPCPCPSRLAAGTVDSMIGKLSSLFADIGRGGEWNDWLGVSNPASHRSVKAYLKTVREEQAISMVTPKQAIPIFFEKLTRLCAYLREKAFQKDISPVSRFLHARDLAFFCLDFYAGDRASDLGRVFTKEVLTSADGQFLLFRHTFGKTLRGKDTNIFKVKRCENPIVCPVGNIKLYVNMCDLMAINLRDGYLFRVTDRKGLVTESPFMGSAVSNRLTLHLKSLNLYQGESAHSFRSGCAITFALLGVSQEDVARHVGWKSLATAEYYSQCSKGMDSGHTASTLAASTKSAEGSSPQAASLPQTFQANNELKNRELAFK